MSEHSELSVEKKKKIFKIKNESVATFEDDISVEEISVEKKDKRSRSFIFTFYHPKLNDERFKDIDSEYYLSVREWFECDLLNEMNPKYWIYQHEICPKTERNHFQGFIRFNNARSFNSTRKNFLNNHIEECKNELSCEIYCKKGRTRANGPWEYGTKDKQGERKDIAALRDAVLSGKKEMELIEDNKLINTYARHIKFVDRLYELRMKKFSNFFRKVEVEIIWGAAGTGKTRSVYDKHGYEDVYRIQCINDKVWLDGYMGEDVVIIDDFYGWIKWSYFLALTDGHPCRLDIKTRSAWACWTKVYITSNVHPLKWYPRKNINGKLRYEFERRLTQVTYVPDQHVASESDTEVTGSNTSVPVTSRVREQLKLGLYTLESTSSDENRGLFSWSTDTE
jgi:hypothetical protein